MKCYTAKARIMKCVGGGPKEGTEQLGEDLPPQIGVLCLENFAESSHVEMALVRME
jgi:hypothetical protein